MADVNGDFVSNQINALAGDVADGAGADFFDGQVAANYAAMISGSSIAAGGALTYRMRAYDTTLSRVVYWLSVTIDTSGAQYTGPGPLSNIVIAKVIGH